MLGFGHSARSFRIVARGPISDVCCPFAARDAHRKATLDPLTKWNRLITTMNSCRCRPGPISGRNHRWSALERMSERRLVVLCQFRSRRRARFNHPARVERLTSSRQAGSDPPVSHANASATSYGGVAPRGLSEPSLTLRPARALLDRTETVSLAAVTRFK
jgi:hypothetical protein